MKKTRVTITISPEVINQIDRLIETENLHNRSQAIETVIQKYLTGQVNQAVILAGGKPDAIETAMTPISGQPLIKHTINLIQSYGISTIFVVTDKPDDRLQAILNEFSNTHLVVQKQPKGTAGSIIALKPQLLPQPVLIIHGDVFVDINLIDLILFHQSQMAKATIVVKPAMQDQNLGRVIMHGTTVTDFKSEPEAKGVGMINTGVYLIDPQTLNRFKNNQKQMLETDIFPKLAQKQQLSGFLFEGIWYDVSKTKK